VTELDNIDDKAMRTTRTGVLIIGFVAAALTAAGPGAASTLHRVPLLFAGVGAFSVFVSAFIGTGIYTLSEYPYEIESQDLHAAGRVDEAQWLDAAIETVDSSTAEIEFELQQNARFLEFSQVSLMFGSTLLITGSGFAVLNKSFGISPVVQATITLALVLMMLVVVTLKEWISIV